MFVLSDTRIPIKIWLESLENIETDALEQARHLASLPFAVGHIALMPDVHQGYGMPIGGVLATEKAIVPNAVGVDIGCGVTFMQTNVPANLLKETQTGQGSLLQAIVGTIMRNVPRGFSHHKTKQQSRVLDSLIPSDGPDEFGSEVESAYYQIGTLGAGNHFIELQADENNNAAIMLHSGSRNLGYKICHYFNQKAQELNERWFSSVPSEWELAFLPIDSEEGQQYINWMNFAQEFARENREKIFYKVRDILYNMLNKYVKYDNIVEGDIIDCHHNFAAIENHFGRNVWVHRKGAIRAREGEQGIIPGAMGSKSYIVRGQGSRESLFSCSHGAGRNSSRKKAREQYSVQKVIEDLKNQGVVLGKDKKEDVAEECRWAYKDIDTVMSQQRDLVGVAKALKTVAVIKG